MITKKRIGVLMGGTSTERDVSLRSGASVFNALKGLGYDAVAIDAGRDVCRALEINGVEIAFIVLHGGTGEDGSMQGLLEVMGIPYTGSGVLASGLAMDKLASKMVFSYCGIPVPRFEVIREARMPSILPPFVVKPQKEGSSVGVSIVKDAAKFREAIDKAMSFNGTAIIEEFIKGREVHIGILNDRVLGGVEVRPSLEFYSYEAKYTPGMTDYIIPPELESAVYESAKEIGLSAHKALGCRGATRVDLMISPDGSPYVLEVNTIPGMTETSLLPKIAGYAGMGFPALVEEILKGAVPPSDKCAVPPPDMEKRQ